MPAPSVQSIIRTGLRYNYGELQFRDFSGGLNIRDAAPELAVNESPDLYNVTLDERGGVGCRLGYRKDNGTAHNASLVNNVFYWAAGQNKITQCGVDVFKDNSLVAFKTFSTSARCGFADFTGNLWIIHPIDGLFSYDGTTVTAATAGPKGTCLAAWQNKLWASGDPSHKARVYFSQVGDGTKWYHTQTTVTAPGISLPVASTTLSGAHTLPVTPVTVVSTAGFAASGAIWLGGQIVHYTAIAGNTFTGCTGGVGTIATGVAVTQALTVGSTTGFNVPGVINVGGNNVSVGQMDATAFADLAGTAGALAAGALVFQDAQNFNDLREKDTEPVVCLAGAAGLDVAGRPGLLAFKRRSTYRIFDSSTGSYQTIDPQIGAAGPLAVTNNFERTIALSEQGVFWTDGVGPLRPASDKINPIFQPGYSDFSSLDNWCAGTKGDRCYFSLQTVGGSANNLELEYHPLQGWFTANSSSASCYATYGLNTQKLVAGSPTVVGQVWERLVTGADNGAAITSRFQTHWIEPTRGHPLRVLRCRLTGRGLFTLNTIVDYQLSLSEAYPVSLVGSAGIWDNAAAIYDNAATLYGPTAYKDTTDLHLNVVEKAIALQVTASTTTSSSALQILGSGTAPEIGAWGLYGIDLSYAPLGLS